MSDKTSVTPKKLEDLIKLAQKYGLKSLKLGTVEFEFKAGGVPVPLDPKLFAELTNEKMPTEEQFKYWSTDYDPEENTEQRIKS